MRSGSLFFVLFYTGLPQDPKSRTSSFHAGGSGSDESLNTSVSDNTLTSGNLSKDQSSLSHPDLSEMHKTRAATLPARGFRTGNSELIIYYNTFTTKKLIFVYRNIRKYTNLSRQKSCYSICASPQNQLCETLLQVSLEA